MSAIRGRGLSKSFGDVTALSRLSVTVDHGELYGFLGPNGAGKTTTIGVLTGQLRPDAGTVEVLGTDPTVDPVETRRRVGVLPERESPPSFMTPREYFDFVGAVRSIEPGLLRTRVEEWIDRLAFRDQLDTLHVDLSRGQQQKVLVTQAFLHDPALVFIDEPLANLDPIIQARLKRYLGEYVDAGNTVFLSTHYIETAEALCSRVGVVNEGQLVTERRTADLDSDESLLDLFLEEVALEAGAISDRSPHELEV